MSDSQLKQANQVIVPVALCAIYTAIIIRILEWSTDRSVNIIHHTWNRLGLGSNQDIGFSKTLLNNTIIVAVFLLLIVIVTLMILFVLYMGWSSCLNYYFYIPSFIIMALLTPIYIKEILASLNWFGIDLITIVLFTWNFVAMGMIAIFQIYIRGPLLLQQFYLIHNSAILAVVMIKALPSWAPWLLLSLLVFWDLFAVLAPCGPLNLIIDIAEREGLIEMPGLVYTTDTMSPGQQEPLRELQQTEGHLSIKSQQQSDLPEQKQEARQEKQQKNQPKEQRYHQSGKLQNDIPEQQAERQTESQLEQQQIHKSPQQVQQQTYEEKGINIGLGDFIFYSLLVGLTAKGRQLEDFYSILSSTTAILFGLVLTLLTLTIAKRALPALPISLILGIIVSGITIYFVPAFFNKLAAEQIFI